MWSSIIYAIDSRTSTQRHRAHNQTAKPHGATWIWPVCYGLHFRPWCELWCRQIVQKKSPYRCCVACVHNFCCWVSFHLYYNQRPPQLYFRQIMMLPPIYEYTGDCLSYVVQTRTSHTHGARRIPNEREMCLTATLHHYCNAKRLHE